MEVRGNEQRVVVEHLLEVRDEPALVDRVAVEAAAEEVVHPAECHPVQRRRRQLQRLVVAGTRVQAQQELDRGGLRELRRAPPATPLRVEPGAQSARRVPQQRVGEGLARRLEWARRAHRISQRLRLLHDVVATLTIRVRHGDEHLREARQTVARLRREVRPAEERLALGGEEDRHRPAALTRQGDDRVHVQRVDVGPLLAVDLDVTKRSFMSAAVAASSKDSCAMTWHQWHAA